MNSKQPVKESFNLSSVMKELATLGNEQIKQIYMNHGAREPLFGVTTKALKPLAKKIKKNHELAMQLYATGNYDAMYFAGMIADPTIMSKEDIELWMKEAYCQGISDYVVAITLSELPFAQEVALKWIRSNQELYQSAGYSCYACMLGHLPDSEFDIDLMHELLLEVERTIHTSYNRTRYAMNSFVIAMGISYLPLHEQALQCANAIGEVHVLMENTSCKTPLASKYIEKAISSNRIGWKRRYVRC